MSLPAKAVSGQRFGAVRALSEAGTVTTVYCLLCALSLFPFLWFSEPPITDFANHAARLFIACHAGDPAFQAMYHYRLGIIPDLAVDAVNLPLCAIVAPSLVLRLVTASSLILIYASSWLIQRRLFGRPNAFLFLAPAIAFNIVTLMGYINYLAGIAIVFAMVALAVGRKRSFRSLLLLCNIGGLALFFSHIFALAFALMVFFGLMLSREPMTIGGVVRAGLRTLALFALPIMLMGFVPSSEHHLVVGYGDKLRALPPLIMSKTFSMRFCGVVLAAMLYLGVRSKSVRLHPSLRYSLAIVGLFVLCGPNQVQQAFDVDVRTLVALAYLAFSGLAPVRHERETSLALALASAALVATQLWTSATVWTPFSRQIDELRAATTVLPPTAKTLAVTDIGPRLIAWPTAYVHVTSYATVDHRIFNPLEFTGVGMQPLWPTAAYAPIDPEVGPVLYSETANRLINPIPQTEIAALNSPMYRFAIRWPQTFDYVIYYHFGRPQNLAPGLLATVRSGSFFTIYKIKHPPAVAATSRL